jgi:hypothetical protein
MSNNQISTKWEIEIPDSHLCKGGGTGTFCVTNEGDLILSYNQNRDYVFHRFGKLIRINQHKIKEFYKTKYRLWAPVLYNKEVYMVTQSTVRGMRVDRGILSKFNATDNLEWQFTMDGATESLPVVWKDSIFVTDSLQVKGAKRKRNLYRLNNLGEMVFKRPIQDSSTFEPWIMKEKEQFILRYSPDILKVFDFSGNDVMMKKINGVASVIISDDKKERLFATTVDSIAALDQELNIRWEYRPFHGIAGNTPVFDSEGNLYAIFHPRLLKSLDQHGKERWQNTVMGYGYQPCVLANNIVLTATSRSRGHIDEQEMFSTWVELFSDSGAKLANMELAGSIFHCARVNPLEVIVATNCTRIDTLEGVQVSSIKIYSINTEI